MTAEAAPSRGGAYVGGVRVPHHFTPAGDDAIAGQPAAAAAAASASDVPRSPLARNCRTGA
jgi:hypothetical protein